MERIYGVRKADRSMGANELVNYAFLSRDGAKKLAEFLFFSFLFFSLYTAFYSSSLSSPFKRIISFDSRISFFPVHYIGK